MTSLDGYNKKFAANYPETGEVQVDTVLNGEQAQQLGELFSRKIVLPSRKPTLTGSEATFVDSVRDKGSRIVIGAANKGVALPDSKDHESKLMHAAARLYDAIPRPWPIGDRIESQEDVLTVMDGLTGSTVGIKSNPVVRGVAEDYATTIMPYFADMVTANGGLRLDESTTANLRHLIAQYEASEQEPAQ